MKSRSKVALSLLALSLAVSIMISIIVWFGFLSDQTSNYVTDVTGSMCGTWKSTLGPKVIDGGLNSIAITSDNNIWSVGEQRGFFGLGDQRILVQRFSDGKWGSIGSDEPNAKHLELNDIAIVADNDVWVVGDYQSSNEPVRFQTLIEHWNGTEWSTISSPNPSSTYNELSAVAFISPTNVWAVGYYKDLANTRHPLLIHWDGQYWSNSTELNTNLVGQLNDVAAISANDIWAVGAEADQGNSLVIHSNGTVWTTVNTPNILGLSSISLLSTGDVWVASEDGSEMGSVLHWNGQIWSPVTSDAIKYSSFSSIKAISDDNVWAVGSSWTGKGPLANIAHWNGNDWSNVSPPKTLSFEGFNDVAVTSKGDVWIVGEAVTGELEPYFALAAQFVPSICS